LTTLVAVIFLPALAQAQSSAPNLSGTYRCQPTVSADLETFRIVCGLLDQGGAS
jgi:hypothetical protein